MSHAPSPGSTDGEATNPGPHQVFVSTNVSSLNKQHDAFLRLPGTVRAVQETKFAESDQVDFRTELSKRGQHVVFGRPLPAKGHERGGVAIVSERPLAQPAAISPQEQTLLDSKRYVRAALPLGDGKCCLHIVSFYGYTNAARNACERAKNEELLGLLFEVLAALGQVPILILGDFNTNSTHSTTLDVALRSQQWYDAALIWEDKTGQQAKNTCFVRATSQGSRIDLALMNRQLASTLQDFQTLQETGIHTHDPLQLTLDVSLCEQTGKCIPTPLPFPLDWQDPVEDAENYQKESLSSALLAQVQSCWKEAKEARDTDALYRIFSDVSESYLGIRAFGAQPPRRYTGRSRVPKTTLRQAATPHQHPLEGAQDMAEIHLVKLTRRVQELIRKLTHRHVIDPLAPDVLDLWDKCRQQGLKLLPDWGAWQYIDLPDLGSLKQLEALMRAQEHDNKWKQRASRISAWKERFQEDWRGSRRMAYEFARGGKPLRPPVLERPNGSLTGCLQEMEKMLTEAWEPTFCMYANMPPPSVTDFVDRYGAHIPARHGLAQTLITVEDIKDALKRMSADKAFGAEGWRRDELLRLPENILALLAELYEMIECTGSWPQAVSLGVISMLPKGAGLRPGKLRPITVMSLIYRTWAAIRVRELMNWQDQWIHKAAMGFRHLMGCDDVFWVTAAKVEAALLSGEPLCGASLDFAKAFDRVPREIVFHIAEATGMPPGTLGALKGMYRQSVRRFRMPGDFVTEEFGGTNGVLQGCPISVILMNMLMHIWCSVVEHETEASPSCFADDASAVCPTVQGVKQVLEATAEFCQFTGMQLHIDKSNTWATTRRQRAKLRKLTVAGQTPEVVETQRNLGAQLNFTRANKGRPDVAKRSIEAVQVCERIQGVPLGTMGRATLVQTAALPKVLFDSSVSRMCNTEMQLWRTRCSRTIWGNANPARCNEVIFSLLTKGHGCDPRQLSVLNTIRTARRMLRKHPEMIEVVTRSMSGRKGEIEANRVSNLCGPAAQIIWAATQLGWQPVSAILMVTHTGDVLDMLNAEEDELLHMVRERLRSVVWREAGLRRRDMAGLEREEGVDRAATCALLQSSHGADKYILERVLAGAIMSRERRHKRRQQPSPMCTFCWRGQQHVPETVEHITSFTNVLASHLQGPACLPSRQTHRLAPNCVASFWNSQRPWRTNNSCKEHRSPRAHGLMKPRRILQHSTTTVGLWSTRTGLARKQKWPDCAKLAADAFGGGGTRLTTARLSAGAKPTSVPNCKRP